MFLRSYVQYPLKVLQNLEIVNLVHSRWRFQHINLHPNQKSKKALASFKHWACFQTFEVFNLRTSNCQFGSPLVTFFTCFLDPRCSTPLKYFRILKLSIWFPPDDVFNIISCIQIKKALASFKHWACFQVVEVSNLRTSNSQFGSALVTLFTCFLDLRCSTPSKYFRILKLSFLVHSRWRF